MTSLVVLSNWLLLSMKRCGSTGTLIRGGGQRGEMDSRADIGCA